MEIERLTSFFKRREIFSILKVESNLFFVRCDGRNFRKLASSLGLGPFDNRFRKIFLETVLSFLSNSGFDIKLAYYSNDEISYLVVKRPFNGRVEKIDSVFASLTSSIFTIKLFNELKILQPVSFDARIIPLDNLDQVIEYLIWRQLDNFRNFLNKAAQLTLLKKGYNAKTVARKLSGVKGKELVKIIEEEYCSLENFPNWMKLGDLVYKIVVEKNGFNPIKNEKVTVKRKRYVIESFNFQRERSKLERILEEIKGNSIRIY